ncbi:MAG: hypothetical protein QOE61_3772 [Micromonosporaceae bacterium]|nr:hypothetical protein [Micromonosporaceae bacterium]
MFTKQESRRHKGERIAGQAWDNLSAAVDTAGASTKSASRKAAGIFDDTSNRVGSGAKEARKRANAAFDALAGRRRPLPWGWLAAAGLVGAAVGWVVTTAGRQFLPHRDALELPDSLADDRIGGAGRHDNVGSTRN